MTETTKKLKKDELFNGDIILFSPARDTESQLIAKLTNADVTHSAIVCGKGADITEEMPPFASQNPISGRILDTYKDVTYERTLHVLRLTEDCIKEKNIKTMQPVLDRADLYMEKQIPYSYESLVIMGLYTVIRKLLPKKHLKLATRLLQVATVELAKVVNDIKFKGIKPFVCSQYVYNCFYTAETAGKEDFRYALKIKPGVLDSSLLNVLKSANVEDQSYLKLSDEDAAVIQKRIEVTLKEVAPDLLTKKGIMTFVEHYVEEVSGESVDVVQALDLVQIDHQDFAKAVHDFFALLVQAYDLNVDEKHKTPLEKAYAFQEFFITPQDLYVNMVNLYKVGIVDNDAFLKK